MTGLSSGISYKIQLRNVNAASGIKVIFRDPSTDYYIVTNFDIFYRINNGWPERKQNVLKSSLSKNQNGKFELNLYTHENWEITRVVAKGHSFAFQETFSTSLLIPIYKTIRVTTPEPLRGTYFKRLYIIGEDIVVFKNEGEKTLTIYFRAIGNHDEWKMGFVGRTYQLSQPTDSGAQYFVELQQTVLAGSSVCVKIKGIGTFQDGGTFGSNRLDVSLRASEYASK